MRLYRQLHPDDTHAPAGARDLFKRILTSADFVLLVLEHEGAVAASTYLNIIPNLTRRCSPYAVVENVVVEESMRGRGLGKQIMAATLAKAWTEGCYKAMLLTGSQDDATHAFYRSCGFSPDARRGYLARPPRRISR